MWRWWICMIAAVTILIALFVQVANIIVPLPIIKSSAEIATILTVALSLGCIIGQWQFPLQPAPQGPQIPPKFWKALWRTVIVLGILGSLIDSSLGVVFHTISPFDLAVLGKTIKNTDFQINKWDNRPLRDGSCTPQTNSYTLEAFKDKGTYGCFLSKWTVHKNMALRVNINLSEGTDAGVIFMDTALYTHYLYSINIEEGSDNLVKTGNNKIRQTLTEGPEPSIKKGRNTDNLLEITVIDNTICVYANKQQISCPESNPVYESGTIGFFAGAYPTKATFSQLTVWQL